MSDFLITGPLQKEKDLKQLGGQVEEIWNILAWRISYNLGRVFHLSSDFKHFTSQKIMCSGIHFICSVLQSWPVIQSILVWHCLESLILKVGETINLAVIRCQVYSFILEKKKNCIFHKHSIERCHNVGSW